jgi:hypothetical protein
MELGLAGRNFSIARENASQHPLSGYPSPVDYEFYLTENNEVVALPAAAAALTAGPL